MATKNISITEEAYHRLVSRRQRQNESFTEVINRITQKAKLSDFFGIWSKETADEFENNLERVRKSREKANKERIERIKKGFN